MDTEERLAKLEQELLAEKRRTRWLLAVVGLGVVGVGLTWALATITSTAQGASTGPKVSRATQFILEDETGKARARLVVDKDGPGLALYDETGQIRAGLAVDKDGPRLALGDETGKARAGLTVSKDGPRLALSDETGKVIWSQP
jgi:hypothetical protein